MENSKKGNFVGFGLGPIQTGLFLYEAYRSGNFKSFTVAEVDDSLVDAVNRSNGRCTINITFGDNILTTEIEGVRMLNPRNEKDREELIRAISVADEIATSLPSIAFYDKGEALSVASCLADGLGRRASGQQTIVYTAENNNHAAEALRAGVEKSGGNQVINFNSLFQLFAMSQANNSLLKATKEILFMADALAYMLTGNKVVEYTIASTSQILNPRTKKFEAELLENAGVSPSVLGDVVMPGHLIGTLRNDLAVESELGKVRVVAVAGHDTASAVAAVPAVNENFAYLSSGTWSIMGIELREAIINEQTLKNNFTNEGGVEGTIRFLKNITGMWILEQCMKEWKKEGVTYSYENIVQMAETGNSFQSLIDPDYSSFVNPSSMIKAIQDYCSLTSQIIPQTHPDFVRCIFESLSLKYRNVIGLLKDMAPFPIEKLHVVGGGSKNVLLNQWIANSIGIPVIAGPTEASAIGNIMIQAKAAGCVESLPKIRQIIAKSVHLEEFSPENTGEWDEAYYKFLSVSGL